jgi:hypothetical protein
MKVVTRRSFVIIFATSVICFLLRYAGNYIYGYSGMQEWPFAILVVCFLVEYLMFPLMLLAWLIALVRKVERSWASRVMAIFLAWGVLTWFLPAPWKLLLFGLRDRMVRDFGVEKLRGFAHDFDQLPTRETDVVTLTSVSRKLERQDLPQTGLPQKYSFLAWMKVSRNESGPSYVDERNGIVEVRWGGPLGHWGFSVSIGGTKIAPSQYTAQMLKIGDDIYFIREG